MTLSLRYEPYRLRLRRPFVTAAATHEQRRGYIVWVEDGRGAVGVGEAAPLPGHGGERLEDVPAALAVVSDRLQRMEASGQPAVPDAFADLVAIAQMLEEAVPAAPAARAAVDLALADLAAQRAGVPLARWFGHGARSSVPVNAVIGAVEPAEAAGRAEVAVAEGFRTIKLKIGGSAAADLARITEVRWAVGPDVALRADANGAWDEEAAVENLSAMAPLGLEYVEQPVPAGDVASLARLRRSALTPVAADEALLLPGGPDAVLDAAAADVYVLKPALLGGVSACWVLAERAATAGVSVVVTTALDSAVGRLGALHLAAALPGLTMACGLATGDLLAEDVAETPPVAGGRMSVPIGPGLGAGPVRAGA